MRAHDIQLRIATIADLPEMQQLFADTIAAVCRHDYTPEQLTVWISSIENTARWQHILTTQYVLIAAQANKIVGYTSLENYEYVDLLYVHKDYQRQGIADILYTNIESMAKNKGTKILHSDVSITARPFFERKGFTVINTNHKVIRNVETSNYRMEKTI